jgi:hypothetical protein
MIAGLIYVVGMFSMLAVLIVLVHRAMKAEHASFADGYDEASATLTVLAGHEPRDLAA